MFHKTSISWKPLNFHNSQFDVQENFSHFSQCYKLKPRSDRMLESHDLLAGIG